MNFGFIPNRASTLIAVALPTLLSCAPLPSLSPQGQKAPATIEQPTLAAPPGIQSCSSDQPSEARVLSFLGVNAEDGIDEPELLAIAGYYLRYQMFLYACAESGSISPEDASLAFPPPHEAVANLPGTESVIVMQLLRMHPFLAEYNRFIELRVAGETVLRMKLDPDTGGYSRTQLYDLGNGEMLVLGYFDALLVDTTKNTATEAPTVRPAHAVYLGAFEREQTRRWRFAAATECPEILLKPRGG